MAESNLFATESGGVDTPVTAPPRLSLHDWIESSTAVPRDTGSKIAQDLTDATNFSLVDGNAHTAETVAAVAAADVGKKFRDQSNTAAIDVSTVLKSAGVSNIEETWSVNRLADQLLEKGWMRLPATQMEPGDVVIGLDRQGGGDVGIVGENGAIYATNSANSVWSKSSADGARFSPRNPRWAGGSLYAYRAPGTPNSNTRPLWNSAVPSV